MQTKELMNGSVPRATYKFLADGELLKNCCLLRSFELEAERAWFIPRQTASWSTKKHATLPMLRVNLFLAHAVWCPRECAHDHACTRVSRVKQPHPELSALLRERRWQTPTQRWTGTRRRSRHPAAAIESAGGGVRDGPERGEAKTEFGERATLRDSG
jgi:hypothetical protein